MNVAELRERLADFDDDTPVHFVFPAHDYLDTQLTTEIREADELDVVFSELFQTTKLPRQKETGEYYETDLERVSVVVLS